VAACVGRRRLHALDHRAGGQAGAAREHAGQPLDPETARPAGGSATLAGR
jgi:hypothetical protein